MSTNVTDQVLTIAYHQYLQDGSFDGKGHLKSWLQNRPHDVDLDVLAYVIHIRREMVLDPEARAVLANELREIANNLEALDETAVGANRAAMDEAGAR